MYSVIAYDGQVYGPVDARTLISWCQQGRIVASTHLVETATGRSFLASDMPELAAVLASSVQPQVSQQPYNPYPPSTPQTPGISQQPYQPQGGSYHAPPQFQGGFPSSPQIYGAGAAKSRRAAMWWLLLLGPVGAHRFYLGHRTSAIAMLALGLLSFANNYCLVIDLIWTTIDFVRLMSGTLLDAQGVAPR